MIRFIPYRLALKQPLCLPGIEPLRFREGLLVHRPDTGGWGDAAPLPGYSSESLAELLEVVKSSNPDCAAFPSLRFALECAERSFSAPEQSVKVNALWIVEKETLADLLLRLRDWPRPVIKVKPGASPQASALLELLAQRPDCRLRVDGNRQWSVEQTLQLYDQLPDEAVEYMEEPLADPDAYLRLWSRADLPVALDECLLEPIGKELILFKGVKALILKPTLLGNASDRSYWIQKAGERNIKWVWSSCFESGVGLWHIARLAQKEAVAGLDTGGVFKQDLLSPRPLVFKGEVIPPKERELHVFENGLIRFED